jgi:hypothetical protein
MNQKVWEKAVQDTLGLQSYFDQCIKDAYTLGQPGKGRHVSAVIRPNMILDQVKDQINDLSYHINGNHAEARGRR